MFYCLGHWCVEKTEMWTLPSFVFPPHTHFQENIWSDGRDWGAAGHSIVLVEAERRVGWQRLGPLSLINRWDTGSEVCIIPTMETQILAWGSKGKIYKKGPFPDLPYKVIILKRKKRPTQLEATKQSLRDALSGRISNIFSPKGNSHILSAPIVEHSLIGFHPLLNTHF